MMIKYLSINPKVQKALDNNNPIVALESTIISHGMPYPQNVETALNAQKIIREKGVTPATIAIIKGKLKVGLTDEEIDYLGKKGQSVLKTSTRDIPYIISQKLDGATTVSATSFIASLVGIKIFATGGIGGVHRGAPTTFDISSDLEELSKTNIAVVCAGAKSILDLELTTEYLETKEIEVIGYKTNFLPAFYTSKSEFSINHRLDSPEEIADLLKAKWAIGLKGGVLITNPIPEEYEMDP
ncbi:MAG: pseudouridine-5'-phosphate glycosidase, partial [Bacilli bacterium]|nr:pseudouridine-5'-phosphate glycosidase [Bacilli bacterium]